MKLLVRLHCQLKQMERSRVDVEVSKKLIFDFTQKLALYFQTQVVGQRKATCIHRVHNDVLNLQSNIKFHI